LHPPKTPYVLRSSAVIPAILLSGINSELPGKVIAQVSQNIYDTPTGMHLLIPQGSRLEGEYSSDISFGQRRIFVAWQRIIFPDGHAIALGSMPGMEGAGYAGFIGKVNNHYWRLFGNAILLSGIVAGITLSQEKPGDTSQRQRASDAMSAGLGVELGQVTKELIVKNMNIAPTIEVQPGYRFTVFVNKDLNFDQAWVSPWAAN
jgi:type IV secretion system protein VirB10